MVHLNITTFNQGILIDKAKQQDTWNLLLTMDFNFKFTGILHWQPIVRPALVLPSAVSRYVTDNKGIPR